MYTYIQLFINKTMSHDDKCTLFFVHSAACAWIVIKDLLCSAFPRPYDIMSGFKTPHENR